MTDPIELFRCSDCGKITPTPYAHAWRVQINGADQGEVHFYLCDTCRDQWSFGSASVASADGAGMNVVIGELAPEPAVESPAAAGTNGAA